MLLSNWIKITILITMHSDCSTGLREYKPLHFVILLFEDVPIAKRKIFIGNTCTKNTKILHNYKGGNHIEKNPLNLQVISYANFFYPYRILRSVAYRQFVRLAWEYVGRSNRLPLPILAVCTIR